MTTRPTASTITDVQLDALYERLAKAEHDADVAIASAAHLTTLVGKRSERAEQAAEKQQRRADIAEKELHVLRSGLRANGADPTQIQNLWAQIRLRNRQWREEKQRAEQAEELLRIAHDTSNKSEGERARAVQRAEQAEEGTRRALEQRQEMAEERYAWQERGDRAEAAIARVRKAIDSVKAADQGHNPAVDWVVVRVLEAIDARLVNGGAPAQSGPAATQATDPLRQVANDAICDTYQPPTTPAESGLCARCGMYDYKHQEQP